jgi:type IV pilus assembly protein PilA
MRKRKGFTLVEIMIVVAIIALLSAIAIPNLLRARIAANESAAQTGLRTLSTAVEAYAAVDSGNYAPADNTTTDNYLRTAAPAYLNTAFCGQTLGSYTYTCDIDRAAYSITAVPSPCGTSGNRNFTVTSGGVLTSAACS